MPWFSTFNDSVRCCCPTRRSCWMSPFSAFSDSACTTVRSGVVSFYFVKINTFLTSRYMVLMLLWIDWYSTQPINTHAHQNVHELRSFMLTFSSVHLRVFSAHYFVKLSPLRNSYPGSHGTHSSPFPTTARAFVLIARTKMFIIMLPSLASPCV